MKSLKEFMEEDQAGENATWTHKYPDDNTVDLHHPETDEPAYRVKHNDISWHQVKRPPGLAREWHVDWHPHVKEQVPGLKPVGGSFSFAHPSASPETKENFDFHVNMIRIMGGDWYDLKRDGKI